MNDAYDDDAVGWDSLVGYPDPNVTIPVSYEAFVEEWNSEMVYVFDRQEDVATITQTCSVVKNLVEYDVVVGDRLVVEPKLGRGIDRYRSYRLLYDSVGRRRSGFHGSGAAFPKGGPAAVSVGLCIVPPSVPVCRSRDSGSVPGDCGLPAHRLLAVPGEVFVGFREVPAAEKAVVGGEGRGCGHLSTRLRVGSTIAPLRCA